jgi:hypothetical protein
MKTLFPILIVLMALMFPPGCSQSHVRPAGTLDPHQFNDVLWDLIRADEFVTAYLSKDSTRSTSPDRMRLYQQILTLHKVSQEQFRNSYNYYMTHPDEGTLLLDSLTAKANRERNEAYRFKSKAVTVQ